MRVATYTQPGDVTRSSLVGLLLLVATILLGSTAVLRLVQVFAPGMTGVVTLLWLVTYAAALVGLMAGHGINWISWLVRYRLLLVILMLGSMASIGWAFDTQLSLERTVHLIGCTLIAIYLGFTVPLLNMLRVLAVVLSVLLIASLGASLLMPELGIQAYEGQLVWRGVVNSKNALGFWAATGFLLYLTLSDSVRTSSTRLLCYLMAALSLVLLVLSQSATSLLVMVVAGAFALYLFVAARFKLGFISMLILAVFMVGLVALISMNVSTAELVGRSDDLTGRGEVWRQTWQLIMQRPATGFGYGVLWFPSDETAWIQDALTDFTWTVHHAHNGFLQVASEIGLPLAVIASLMVVQQLIEILYCQYQRQQVGVLFVLAFTLTYLLSNFSEARFLVSRELFWILFIALPISMLRQINVAGPQSASAYANPMPGNWAAAVPGHWAHATAPRHGQAFPAATGVNSTSMHQSAAQPGAAGKHTVGIGDPLLATGEALKDRLAQGRGYNSPAKDDLDVTIYALNLADVDIDLGASIGSRSGTSSRGKAETYQLVIDEQRHIGAEKGDEFNAIEDDDITGEFGDEVMELVDLAQHHRFADKLAIDESDRFDKSMSNDFSFDDDQETPAQGNSVRLGSGRK